MSSKRQSTVAALPKPPTKISPSAIIPDNAILTGTYPITIGANTVIHPRAKLVSTHGPITIGDFTIISERSTIGPAASASGEAVHELLIEDHVNIEPGAVIEAAKVGKATCIEANARISDGAVVGKVRLLQRACKSSAETSMCGGVALQDRRAV